LRLSDPEGQLKMSSASRDFIADNFGAPVIAEAFSKLLAAEVVRSGARENSAAAPL